MTAGELMVAQRVETREELSFDEIFESYQERIYNCIYRLVGNPEEAHDLTQETFLRAYAGLPKIDGELKVGPWLYRIATNLCMDQLRRRKLIRWEPWESFVASFTRSRSLGITQSAMRCGKSRANWCIRCSRSCRPGTGFALSSASIMGCRVRRSVT